MLHGKARGFKGIFPFLRTAPVQQEVALGRAAQPSIELRDPVTREVEQLAVAVTLFFRGIDVVGEQCEEQIRLGVGERAHLEILE